MSNRPPLNWSRALSDLRADRAVRPDIRENAVSEGMTAWRGKSGARYIVTPKAREAVPCDAVMVAVVRNAAKVATLVAVASFDADATGFALFRSIAHAAGATELHVHSIARNAAACAAIVADLAPGARIDASAFAAAPLATSGSYDRAAIMNAAVALVRTRQAATGEAWAACIGPALRAAWAVAKAARFTLAH